MEDKKSLQTETKVVSSVDEAAKEKTLVLYQAPVSDNPHWQSHLVRDHFYNGFLYGATWQSTTLKEQELDEDEIRAWYTKWMKDKNKKGVATVNVVDMLIDFAALKPIAKEQDTDKKEFLDYTTTARDEFVSYINSLEWNTELRTKVEDLLIAYDQLKERYKNSVVKEQ